MNISNIIASMISDMLEDDGYTEIQRNELAQKIGCVPSQINYVISSRFTPEHGYIVESRRGGGGYIKIKGQEETIQGTVDKYIFDFATGQIDNNPKSILIIRSESLSSSISRRITKDYVISLNCDEVGTMILLHLVEVCNNARIRF